MFALRALFALLWLSLTASAALEKLPSADSSVALLSPDSDRLYLFFPGSQLQIFSLDTSKPFKRAALSSAAIRLPAPQPPALDSKKCGPNARISWTPYVTNGPNSSQDGLYLLASTCCSAVAMSLQKLSSNRKRWMQQPLAPSKSFSSTLPAGRYLASGFASTTTSDLSEGQSRLATAHRLYLFGGVCPTTENDSAAKQSFAGEYSSTLTSLSLPVSSSPLAQHVSGENTTIVVSQDALSGHLNEWPIPSALFTTTLLPKEKKVVAVGGMTTGAQLGLHQLAVYDLADQVWEFRGVESPQGVEIQARSGHSAVLSKDGKSIIVYGGFAKGKGIPATPRLVVLDMGAEDGIWRWAVPEEKGGVNGPSEDGGHWGHAAGRAGGVMVVAGGWMMHPTQKRWQKNGEVFLWDLETGEWVQEHSPKQEAKEEDDQASKITDGPEGSKKKRNVAGVAVGVVFSIAGFAALFGLVLWLRKRRRRSAYARANADEDCSFTRRPRGAISTLQLRKGGHVALIGKPKLDDEGSPSSVETCWPSSASNSTLAKSNSTATSVTKPASQPPSSYHPKSFSPIPEEEEYRPGASFAGARSHAGPPMDVANIYRRSYELARELTAMEDQLERARTCPQQQEQQPVLNLSKPLPPVCEGALPNRPLPAAQRTSLSSLTVTDLPQSLRAGMPSKSAPELLTISTAKSSLTPSSLRSAMTTLHGPRPMPASPRPSSRSSLSSQRRNRQSLTSPVSIVSPLSTTSKSLGVQSTSVSSASSSSRSWRARHSFPGGWENGDEYEETPTEIAEAAVESSVVQVMFTAPKGTLRVVNLGGDEEEEDWVTADEKSLKKEEMVLV